MQTFMWRPKNVNLFPPCLKVREFQLPQSYHSALTKCQRVGTPFYSFKVIVHFYLKQRSHQGLDQRILLSQGYYQQVWLISRPCLSVVEKQICFCSNKSLRIQIIYIIIYNPNIPKKITMDSTQWFASRMFWSRV